MSDYISREELLKDLYSREYTNFQSRDFIALVQYQDKADVRENMHGEWTRHTRVEPVYSIDGVKTWGDKCQCNKCTFTTIAVEGFGYYNFCPNCGARMNEENNNVNE